MWFTWCCIVMNLHSLYFWAGYLIAHLLAEQVLFQIEPATETRSCLLSKCMFNKQSKYIPSWWCSEIPSQGNVIDTACTLIRYSQHLYFTYLHSWNLATWSLENNCFLKITQNVKVAVAKAPAHWCHEDERSNCNKRSSANTKAHAV